MLKTWIVVLCVLLALSACGPAAPPEATTTTVSVSTPGPAASPTRTLRPTLTLTATETARPTRTPTLTPTITPTLYPVASLDAPLNPAGPWLLFRASPDLGARWIDRPVPEWAPRLWAANPDGSGLTLLIDEPVWGFEVQPGANLEAGFSVAYLTGEDTAWESTDLWLRIAEFPSGEVRTITRLFDDDAVLDREISPSLNEAKGRVGEIAWSPDGHALAFTSARGSNSSDVFSYIVDSHVIRQLSSGPLQAYGLTWSPDGQYISHEAFEVAMMGGPYPAGAWAARADGSGSVALFDENSPIPEDMTVRPYVLGWVDNTHLLVMHRQVDEHGIGHSESILTFDVVTGTYTTLAETHIFSIAYAPGSDQWLYSTPGDNSRLILHQEGQEIALVEGEVNSGRVIEVWWSQSLQALVAECTCTENIATYFIIDSMGQVTTLSELPWDHYQVPDIYPSPDGRWWAWNGGPDFHIDMDEMIYLGPAGQHPRLLLHHEPSLPAAFSSVLWSPDSQRLYSAGLNTVWLAEAPDFEPRRIMEADFYSIGQLHWIPSTGE